MRLRLLALPLVLALAACDSGDADTLRLDAAFYTGTWRLATVADASGNRTASVRTVVDDLTVRFNADGTFQLDVDFSQTANDGGLADRVIAGTFTAQPDTRRLVLSADGLAPTFNASATARERVSLGAAASVLQVLLLGTGLEFTGTVTLTLDRT